jgi:surface antigen
MRQLLLRVLVAITLVVFVGLFPNTASAATYTRTCYSTGYACDSTGYLGQATWGFVGPHNCTTYAAWRLARNGVPAPGYNLGNGATWAEQAAAHGVHVDHTPAVGAIAQWNAYTAHATSVYGHVGYVQQVGPDYIVVVSDNYPLGQVPGHTDTFTIPVGHAHWPSNFIHFKDLVQPPSSGVFQPYAADFNGDGYADIGMRNTSNGVFFIKHGPNFGDQISYQWAAGAHYQSFTADFNGDGLADIGLRDTTTGTFHFKAGPSFGGGWSYPWAAGSHYQAFVGRFNNDQYADIGLRDTTTGTFHFKLGPTCGGGSSYAWVAGSHYQPYVADFNGDRIGDIGLRDSSNGTFHFKLGPSYGGGSSYAWVAGSHYQPYVADFNGDRIGDIGLRDKDNGVFFIKHGASFGDQFSYQWVAG